MGWNLIRMARYVKQSKYLQQLKENDEICSQAFPAASYLLFLKDRPLLTASPNPFQSKINWRSFEEIQPYIVDLHKSSIVLGVDENADERALFACPIQPDAADEIKTKFEGRFADMRTAIMTLPEEQAHLVGRGYTLLTWNETSKFCCRCAEPLKRTLSGCILLCSNQECGNRVYPSIFPVAITRVLNSSGDKVLLVRQPQYPKGMYSCIAGFVEAGETLQNSVTREIAEEAGICVEKIQFFRTQSWPLPQATLMLGCTAIAMPDSETLDIDKGELEDARWFSKEEVKAAFKTLKTNPGILRNNENNELFVPPKGAIANQLLASWLEDYMPSQL